MRARDLLQRSADLLHHRQILHQGRDVAALVGRECREHHHGVRRLDCRGKVVNRHRRNEVNIRGSQGERMDALRIQTSADCRANKASCADEHDALRFLGGGVLVDEHY